jgi:hypothetical protein
MVKRRTLLGFGFSFGFGFSAFLNLPGQPLARSG